MKAIRFNPNYKGKGRYMTDEEAVDKMTLMSWDQWSAEGVQAVRDTLGPMGEYEQRIFEAGWKLGYSYALEQNQEINRRLRASN